MKTVLRLTLLLISVVSVAQDKVSAGNYIWKNRVLMQQCDKTGSEVTDAIDLNEVGQRFYVLKEVADGKWLVKIADYISIRGVVDPRYFVYNKRVGSGFPEFEIVNGKRIKTRYHKSDFLKEPDIFYLLDEADIKTSAIRQDYVGTSLALGVLSLPFKYRPQKKNDFSGAVNIGAGIGCTIPHMESNDWRFLVLGGLSIGSEKLNVNNPNSTTTVTSSIALYSGSVGIMAQYKKVQVGLFAGTDYISRQDYLNTNWEYRGKPWLSIGLGLSIFSADGKKTSTEVNEKQGPELLKK